MYAEHHFKGLRTKALLAFSLPAACLARFARSEFTVGGGSRAAGRFWAEGVPFNGGDVEVELEAPSPLTQSALALAIPCSRGESKRLKICPTSELELLASLFEGPACGDRRTIRPCSGMGRSCAQPIVVDMQACHAAILPSQFLTERGAFRINLGCKTFRFSDVANVHAKV